MKARVLALAAVALAGCGGDKDNGPAAMQPPAPKVEAPSPGAEPQDGVRTGSFSVAPRVQAPAPGRMVPAVRAEAPAPRLPQREATKLARHARLSALRAHCATRPADDPRCNGTRVNNRVALMGVTR